MSFVDGEVSGSAGEQGNLLAQLPASLLVNHFIPLLEPSDLIRFGTCCRYLREIVFTDDVWRPRCEALGWNGFPRGTSWQAGFSSRRRTLCTECGLPSRYVFALLGCRLCERCEHRSPKYGLVTSLEAVERYGVSYAALAALPYHEACRTRFYLRSDVEAVSRGGRGAAAIAATRVSFGVGDVSDRSDSDGEEEAAEGSDGEKDGTQAAVDDTAAADDANANGSGDESDADGHDGGSGGDGRNGGGGGGGGSRADVDNLDSEERRAEEKAARKAAKKAAKEAQRLKRQLRNTPTRGGTGNGRRSMGSPVQSAFPYGGKTDAGASGAVRGRSVPGQQQQLQQSKGFVLGAGGPQPAHGRRSGAAVAAQRKVCSPTSSCRTAGPLLVAQDDDGDGLALPLEGQAVLLLRSRSRGGGHGGGGGGASSSHTSSRVVKLKSGWAAEREALMAAWGQYGISGLVLDS